MTPQEYREWRPKYSQYDKQYLNEPYDSTEYHEQCSIIGLAAEAGELLALVQKARRKGVTIDRMKVLDELGDVRWYYQYVLDTYKFTDDEVTESNKEKLDARNA